MTYKNENQKFSSGVLPLFLPLAVFEGEALLRHLSHRRRRHRVEDDTVSPVCARMI